MIKAVIFDIDGTLTHSTAWVYLTEKLGGSIGYNDKTFSLWSSGKISKEEGKKRIIENWSKSGKSYKNYWQKYSLEIPFRSGAKDIVKYLKEKGYIVCMITGSFDVYAETVGTELEIDEWYANTKLIWDEGERLIDIDVTIDDRNKKIIHLENFCKINNLNLNECVPVGDSLNDIGLFEKTGNGIYIKSEFEASELEKIAYKKIDNLSQIKSIL